METPRLSTQARQALGLFAAGLGGLCVAWEAVYATDLASVEIAA